MNERRKRDIMMMKSKNHIVNTRHKTETRRTGERSPLSFVDLPRGIGGVIKNYVFTRLLVLSASFRKKVIVQGDS